MRNCHCRCCCCCCRDAPSRGRLPLGLALGLAFLLSFAVACSPKGDPVRQTLDRIVAAAEDRNAEAVLDEVAPDYRDDAGGDRGELLATVKRYCLAYESLSVRLSSIAVEPGTDSAVASFVADLAGKPRAVGGLSGLLPSTARVEFKLRLVRSSQGAPFKVAWMSYTQKE